MIKKEVKKERGMDANKVWDENGNTWSHSIWEAVNPEYTQAWYEKADEAEIENAVNKIIEHYNLVNCVNCRDCGWCVDCENIAYCTNCNSCFHSFKLSFCNHCEFSNFCEFSNYCHYSNNLYNCLDCRFCNELHKENDKTLKSNIYEQQEIKNND